VEAGGLTNGTAGLNPTGNVLTNDTDVDAGDTKTVVGVQAGVAASTSGSVATTVTGTYGSIVINADGSYTYTVDNTNAAVQALRISGQTLTDTFTYTMRDTGGLESTTQIVLTIQGANDTPTAVADANTAVEAGGLTNGTTGLNPSGNVLTNDTDVDAGDTKTVVGVQAGVQSTTSGSVAATVTGTYGSIVINADGSYTYTVDNNNAAVQALRISGQTLTDTFTYTLRDTGGLESTTQIVLTIQGANDTPTAIADADTAVEAGG
ncbi:MAG: VCBS domain-containing protein, partial [Planctomycetota bacterium]